MTSTAQTPEELQPFDDASAVRKVHLEGVLLLGGGRALLMQLAHPAVSQGVAEHSDFSRDPIGRLLRTLRPMLAIAYGSSAEVAAAAGGVNGIHRRVNGEGYDARDPALLLWVLATLIDTTLVMRERFLRPLAPSFAERYYQDMLTVGELLGIERAAAPPDLDAFHSYVEETVSSLQVSDTARHVARQVLAGPKGMRPAFEPMRQLTAGLLPPALRDQFGLSWGTRRETALHAAQSLSRTLLPYTPRRLRYTPGLLLPPSWNKRRR